MTGAGAAARRATSATTPTRPPARPRTPPAASASPASTSAPSRPDAVIDAVTVSVEWKVSAASAAATLGSQAYLGLPIGSELTNTSNPLTDTVDSYPLSGLSRAQLVSGGLAINVRVSRGGGPNFSAFLDAVTVRVDYTIPPRTFAYDANGALVDDAAGRTFSYDPLGRLIGVSEAGLTLSYSLDGEGNRWAETVNGVTTGFDLDLRGLSWVLAAGSRRYLPGDPGAGYEAGGVWYTGLTDRLGSVLGSVAPDGDLSPLTAYDPFGALRAGPAPSGAVGFSGEWADPAGLLNLRFRAYDPALHRFVSPDSLGGWDTLGQSWNRYAYAVNNPFAYTDPTGHLPRWVQANRGELASFAASLLTFGAYDAAVALSGRDGLAGREVSGWERGLYAAGVIPSSAGGPGPSVASAARPSATSMTSAADSGGRSAVAPTRAPHGEVPLSVRRARMSVARCGASSAAGRVTPEFAPHDR